MKQYIATKQLLAIIRLSLGGIFLWAFLDKLFGLGFATSTDAAWLAGGSPTTGFLTYATKGPFADIFQSFAGNTMVDVLFMLGLLFAGVALITGVFVTLGSYTGMSLMFLMYIAGSIFPEHNPLIDDHVIYFFVLWYLSRNTQNTTFGFGKWWQIKYIVRQYPILK